jgi:ABC-type tungstate transport system permease subunit
MNKQEMVEAIQASKSEFVSYGDDGVSVRREDAIRDIQAMDEDAFGNADFYECDSEGNPL